MLAGDIQSYEPANSVPSYSRHQESQASASRQFCRTQWLLGCYQSPEKKMYRVKPYITFVKLFHLNIPQIQCMNTPGTTFFSPFY